jgi:O-antigen/teichoic acid export membrane protein
MKLSIPKNRKELKQHLKNPLYQNAYYLMLGAAITSVLGFVFWIVAAKVYATEAVGLCAAIISASGLLALFSELGLGIGLIRFLPGAGKNGNDLMNTCFTLGGLASTVITLIFLAGLGFWSRALLPVRQHPLFLIAFVVFSIVTALQPLVLNTFLARRNGKFIVITRIIHHSLKIVLLALFAILFNNVFDIFTASVLAAAISLIIAVVWFLPRVQSGYRPFPKIQKKVLTEISHYSAGNYIGRLLLQMTPFILPLMVVNVLGAEMNAYFYIAWTVANVLLVIPSAIFNSMFAEGSNDETSLLANIPKTIKLELILLLPATLLIWLIADKLLLLFGQAYSDNGALLLRIVVLSVIPWSINYLYISIGRVRKDVSGVIKVAGASSGLSLGLSYFMMLEMSLTGVGVGYLAGQSIVAIVIAFHLWQGYHSRAKISGDEEQNTFG